MKQYKKEMSRVIEDLVNDASQTLYADEETKNDFKESSVKRATRSCKDEQKKEG